MMNERPVGTVWSEEAENGVVLHMRAGTGAGVMLTLPNAEVRRPRRRGRVVGGRATRDSATARPGAAELATIE